MQGKYKCVTPHKWDTWERGKKRHIKSVPIGERVVQRCLCDYALVPVIGRSFIYDNGASMLHKGYSFAVRRLSCHLQRHYRKHGSEGYILLFDFRHFFDNVSHRVIKDILRKQFTDERIIRLTESFIDAFWNRGLGLGSQISQTFALEHALEVMRTVCRELEITLNERKTRIQKIRSFTWLKIRWRLTDTGHIIKKIYRRSVTVMRRKLKSFRRRVDEGKMTLEDVYTSFQSWQAYAKQFNAYRTLESLRRLYTDLFVFPIQPMPTP